ncbi:MAG: hypothetical protein AAB675_01285 [Patescibacteria group bacterium]
MKQREILLLSISVFLIIIMWIAFSIYHNLVISKIPQTTAEKIIPISPKFDTAAIDRIKNRQDVKPIFEIPVATQSTAVNQNEIIIETPAKIETVSSGTEGALLQ